MAQDNKPERKLWHKLTTEQEEQLKSRAVTLRVERDTGLVVARRDGERAKGRTARQAIEALP